MNEPWQGAAEPRAPLPEHFDRAARRLGCDMAAIRAVWEVEAAGRHFRDDGSVLRRFEPHHFPRRHWAAIGFSPRAGEAPWRASLRLSSEAMFQAAAEIDREAACRATSWGAPQIMGFNARDAGFASAGAMVRAMARGAPQQLDAFVRLVDAWGLAPAIRAHDWQAFARRYNGSGQVETYARRIEAAWRRHGGAASPQVLRVGARGPAVRSLQQALALADDGVFGPETLAAVEAFQRAHGLPADGVVGWRTWGALTGGPEGGIAGGTAGGIAGIPAHTPAGLPPELPGAEAPPARPTGLSPPAQETPTDAALDRVKEWSAAAGAVAAAVGAVTQALPEAAVTLLVAGAVGLGLLATLAWTIRRVRA